MSKFRLTLLTAAWLLTTLAARGQATASPDSFFGLGELDSGVSGESGGLAGLGIGFRQDNTLNAVNPASLTAIGPQFFIFDGAVSGKISSFQGQGHRYRAAAGGLQRLSIGFRATDRWMMSAGMTPFSSVGYKITSLTPIPGDDWNEQRTTFSGRGGLNRIYWSHGVSLTPHLSVGVTGSVLFGTITHTESDGLWDIRNRSRGQKILFDFGIQYIETFGADTRLTLGATGGYRNTMNLRNTRSATDPEGYTVTDDVRPTTEQVLPEFYGIGATINRRNQFVAGIDYRFQRWSQARSGVSAVRYKDMHRLTAGVSYIPDLFGSRRYWQQIKYQAGVTVNDSYLETSGRAPVNYAATLGAVFPLSGGNTLNLSAEYGKTGLTGSRSAVREDYLKLTLGFSFKERWFAKLRYD